MRTLITTPSHLEAMAFDRPGLEIELSPNSAYLKVGGTLWYAPLDGAA
jgi:hypothetical protein